jgi:prephenate dehydrogenase
VDTNQDNLERALERNVIDSSHPKITEECAQSDLVLLATPVGQMTQIVQQLAPIIGKYTILSDVGSTKGNVLNLFREHLSHHLPFCIAAHPIAGSDRSGAMAAQFGLFKDKKVILCPHEVQNPEALETVKKLWQATGAKVFELTDAKHDQIFATVSHLPHLLAFSFVNQLAKQENAADCLQFAATGFQDFTRIASSHPRLWADVTLANQAALSVLLEQQQQELSHLQALIQQGDATLLTEYFNQAKLIRDQWLKDTQN